MADNNDDRLADSNSICIHLNQKLQCGQKRNTKIEKYTQCLHIMIQNSIKHT